MPQLNTQAINTAAINGPAGPSPPPSGGAVLLPAPFTLLVTASTTIPLSATLVPGPFTLGTTAVVSVPLPAVVSAMTGRYGVGAIRFRFEQQDVDGNRIADISSAVDVEGGTIELDNDRAVPRVLTLNVDGRKMPSGFLDLPWQQQIVAAYCDVNASGLWNRFPLGLFYLDRPQRAFGANSLQDWKLSGSELTILLAAETTENPYTVAAGVNHLSAVAAIIDRLSLRRSLPTVSATLPVSVTWPAGTTLLAIVNDLLFGVNYYPLWADAGGILTTRARIDPYYEVPAVTYDTTQEPRFVVSDQPLTETIELTQFPNVATVAIDDPLRTPAAARRTNADNTSPISTTKVNRKILAQLDGSSSPSTKAVLDLPTANQIGSFELKEAATRAVAAELHTVLDPRRSNREFLALNVSGVERYTRWRVANMSMELKPGGDMKFVLGKVQPLNVT